jgi:hypothetical protein
LPPIGGITSLGFPEQTRPAPGASHDFNRPYGPNLSLSQVPFIGSVNSYAPFPEVNTPWEKIGVLTPVNNDKDILLNLYRRAIAPLQDLWEYNVQDKNGFIVLLRGINYLEDGDIIPYVIGKENLGPFRVHIFNNNKYIWM